MTYTSFAPNQATQDFPPALAALRPPLDCSWAAGRGHQQEERGGAGPLPSIHTAVPTVEESVERTLDISRNHMRPGPNLQLQCHVKGKNAKNQGGGRGGGVDRNGLWIETNTKQTANTNKSSQEKNIATERLCI